MSSKPCDNGIYRFKTVFYFISLVIMVCALAFAASLATPETASAGEYRYIAHQGKVNTKYPGNTVEAFKQAASTDGIWGIETDIWRTKDGKYVCIHGKSGTTASWQNMDVKTTKRSSLTKKKNGQYALPTFEQFLDACKNGGKVAVIELKDKRIASESSYANEIVKVVKDKGMLGKCLFISFQGQSCANVKSAAKKKYKTAVEGHVIASNSQKSVKSSIATAKTLGLDGISVSAGQEAYAAQQLKGSSIKLRGGWTHKTEAEARTAIEKYGVYAATVEFTPVKYTVTYTDSISKATIKTAKVLHGKSVAEPTPPAHAGYTFSGWSAKATNVTGNRNITANYSVNQYSVTFKDGVTNNTISTVKVNHGSSAKTPSAPAHEGYTFKNWDKPASSITSDMTVTAKYERNRYPVTFIDKMTNKSIAVVYVEHGNDAKVPDAPAHVGYHMSKWDGDYKNVKSKRTIYAIYDPNMYTVAFKDGITGSSMTSIKVKHGNKAAAPAARQHTGYTFTRWDKELNAITGDVTVTSLYSANVYKVEYRVPDGTVAPPSSSFSYRQGLAVLPGSPGDIAGKVFAGWYTAESGGTKVDSIGKEVASNIVLYAQYTSNRYTVKYNANGGKGTMADTVAVAGEKVELPKCSYQKTFKVTFDANCGKAATTETDCQAAFLGWATAQDGEVAYKDGAIAESFSLTKGDVVTLYAKWGDATVELPVATKDKAMFDGWFLSSDRSVKAGRAGAGYKVAENITLHAMYTAVKDEPANISYDLDGGTVADGNETQHAGGDDTLLNEPVKEGYEFAGWIGSGLTEPTKDVTVPDGNAKELSYKAMWTASEYTVSFDGNGASGHMDALVLKVGDEAALPACSFTVDKQRFIGWSLSPEGAVLLADKSRVKDLAYSGEVRLYARWMPDDALALDRRESIQGPLGDEPQAVTGNADNSFSSSTTTVRLDNDGAAGLEANTVVTISSAVPLVLPARAAKVITYTMDDPSTHMHREGTETLPFAGWVDADGAMWKAGAVFTSSMLANTSELSLKAVWKPATVSLPAPESTSAVFAGWYDRSIDMGGLIGEHLVSQDTAFSSRWLDKGIAGQAADAVSVLLDARELNGSTLRATPSRSQLPLDLPSSISCPLSVMLDYGAGRAMSGDAQGAAVPGDVSSWTSLPGGRGDAFAAGGKLALTEFNEYGSKELYPVCRQEAKLTLPKAASNGAECIRWEDDFGNSFEPGEAAAFAESTVLHAVYQKPASAVSEGKDMGMDGATSAASGATPISAAEISGLRASYSYNGTEVVPDISVSMDGTRLVEGEDYKVSVSGNEAPGMATLTVTGIGKYSGEKTASFLVSKDVAEEHGQEEPADNSAVPDVLPAPAPVPTEPSANARDEALPTPSPSSDTPQNIPVPEREVVSPQPDIALFLATVTATDQDYSFGSPVTPPVSVMLDGAVVPADKYDVAYENNSNAGTAKVTVTAKPGSGYTGSASGTFTVRPIDIGAAVISGIADVLPYTGSAVVPRPDGVALAGHVLAAGTDYTVGYADNVEGGRGTAKVVATGKGNYTGSAVKAFSISYPVSYDLNGGRVDGAPSSYLPGDEIALPQPSRTGHSFAGWTGANGSLPQQSASISDKSRGPLSFKANWTEVSYKVSYVLDGGTNAPSNPVLYKPSALPLELSVPSRAEYDFAGWYSDAGLTMRVSSIDKGSVGDKTFYAKWNRKTYPITYVLNGGANPASAPSTYNSDGASLPVPTRAGYKFQGWFSSTRSDAKVSSIPNGSSGAKTFYAKWSVATYSYISASSATRDKNIQTMTARYMSHPSGGIAVIGTSYMSRWDAELTFDALGYDAGHVYNFAIGGDKPSQLCKDKAYINMIVAKKPKVIIFNGCNDLGGEPTNASKNSTYVDKSAGAVETMVSTLRSELNKQGVKPQFVITPSLKTPSRYAKSTASSAYTADKGPKTCALWNRVDAYNSRLKTLASKNADVTYYNLEADFYKMSDGKVRYYITEAEKSSGKPTGRAVKMLKGGQSNVYLGTSTSDRFHHPTKKAYADLFPSLAKVAKGKA